MTSTVALPIPPAKHAKKIHMWLAKIRQYDANYTYTKAMIDALTHVEGK
jgi:hypothetical protein